MLEIGQKVHVQLNPQRGTIIDSRQATNSRLEEYLIENESGDRSWYMARNVVEECQALAAKMICPNCGAKGDKADPIVHDVLGWGCWSCHPEIMDGP